MATYTESDIRVQIKNHRQGKLLQRPDWESSLEMVIFENELYDQPIFFSGDHRPDRKESNGQRAYA